VFISGVILAFPVNGLTCRVIGKTVCMEGITVSVVGVIGSVATPLTFVIDGEIVKIESVAVPVTSVVEGVIIAEVIVLEPATDAEEGVTV